MGPGPACGKQRRRQGEARRSSVRKARPRACLLKGCGRSFEPRCWAQRYCSDSCSQAAAEWRRRKAAWEYRRSDDGKEKRAAQSRRRRARQRQQQQSERRVAENDSAPEKAPTRSSEGHRLFVDDGDFCCDRPGCYVVFDRAPRSPLQHFCSSNCRRALRRVRAREAQWRTRAFFRRHYGRSRNRQRP